MSRKLIVLGLAAVLVVALAIPVVAQERVVTPKLEGISKRALKKSATALRTSRAAAWRARTARLEAQALGQAAAATQAAIESTRIRTAAAAGTVTTGSEGFVALAGGPSVEATVPASGLIEVWAQATIDGEGALALYEDGKPLPGQAGLCGPEGEPGALLAVEAPAGEPLTVSTPAAAGIGICGSFGAPGPVLFQTSPGTHTYELRYASCACGGPASIAFSERRLFVGPRL